MLLTCLPEEILLEVLERTCKYTIDNEVFEEAKKLYDEKISKRCKTGKKESK
ncbi:hypothetical protein K9O30_14130 [Clostridium bowmanii]|uniref:hypothetical protein n=1 Tax=Clostridium bowmanii TaxID=132925 RepID=UPI001C0E4957|nr:hypothetical protein [Clostridium bowmanii]MBU3190187.1 hypothetical protein [Clostridium bowmanii]MCA1074838.1 hypothetical protein [Clostridium bowmanii]